MNRNIAIAIAVIGLFALGAVIIVPAVAKNATGMTVVFYDDTGKKVYEVTTGLVPFGFGFTNDAGAAVTKVVVSVHYVVTAPAGSVVSVAAAEKVLVGYVREGAGALKTTLGTWSSIKTEDTVETTWQLSDLISPLDLTEAAGKGWNIQFTTTLTASATIDGESKSSSCPLSVSVHVGWTETAFSITGSINLL